jgi:hypothetical protein
MGRTPGSVASRRDVTLPRSFDLPIAAVIAALVASACGASTRAAPALPEPLKARPEAAGALIRVGAVELRGQDASHAGQLAGRAREALRSALRAAGFRVSSDETPHPDEAATVELVLTVDYSYADVARVETRATVVREGAQLGVFTIPGVEMPTRLWPELTGTEVANYLSRLDGISPRGAPPDRASANVIAPGHAKEPEAPRPAPVVAVLELQDSAKKLDESTRAQLSDYLAAQVIAKLGWRTIPKDQIRGQLQQEKKASYSACVDESCQIELGKALAAEKVLTTKFLRLDDECSLIASVYDLRLETAEAAATAKAGCRPRELTTAIDALVDRLKTTPHRTEPKP